MKEYKMTCRKGIDDLKSLFAFHGNSQGDTMATNDIEVYKDSKGWMSFTFDCELTQKAIAEEVLKRQRWNAEHIAQLQASGEYGQEYEITVKFAELTFDKPSIVQESPLSSYKMIFLDSSENP